MARARVLENWKRNIRRLRAKQRGIRRSRAKPTEGWTLVDFARLAGVQPRTVRHYLEVGVLPRAPFRGTATRYGRDHLLVVLALRRLQSTENLTLDLGNLGHSDDSRPWAFASAVRASQRALVLRVQRNLRCERGPAARAVIPQALKSSTSTSAHQYGSPLSVAEKLVLTRRSLSSSRFRECLAR